MWGREYGRASGGGCVLAKRKPETLRPTYLFLLQAWGLDNLALREELDRSQVQVTALMAELSAAKQELAHADNEYAELERWVAT